MTPPVRPVPASWGRGTDLAPGIRDLVARALAVDGVAAVSGHVLDAVAAGSADWLPLRDAPDGGPAGSEPDGGPAGSELAGVAVAVARDPAEVVVDPAVRGRGHGTELVRAALDRQGAVWAYGDLPAAGAIARRLGLARVRVLLQMRLDDSTGAGNDPQDTPQDAELPAGVRLRTFVPGRDEQSFLAVNARAFEWHPEQGRLDLAGLRAEMAQSWFDSEGFFLAVAQDDPDRVLGFHWTKIHQDDPTPGPGGPSTPLGEVYVIGVDPAAGIRGLGTPLTTAGLDYLHARGVRTVMLYVEGDNDRALRLYERFGFRIHVTNTVYARPPAPAR
ncbi:mycothiol synthase [Nakamurella sp. GG22]